MATPPSHGRFVCSEAHTRTQTEEPPRPGPMAAEYITINSIGCVSSTSPPADLAQASPRAGSTISLGQE